MGGRAWLRPIRWAAVILGATSGLLAMALLSLAGSIVVNLARGGDRVLLGVVLAAVAVSVLLSGYVAARFGGGDAGPHGAFAGLGFFAVTTVLLVIDGSTASPLSIFLFGSLSLLLGGFGGSLAGRSR